MNDTAIEQQIQAKGLTAPRVTPADLKANIVSEIYFTADDGFSGAEAAGAGGLQVIGASAPAVSLGLLTFCVLVLRNGFTVTGESACASPENFDAEIGRRIARDNAEQKIWPLMGYALKQQLHQRALFDASPKVGYGTQSAGEAVLIPRDPPHIDAQPPVDNAHVAPGAEQFSAADIASAGNAIVSYSKTTGLSFGMAIRMLKDGVKVARAGWNGKGMFVYLVPAASYPVQTGAAKSHYGAGSMLPYNAYLALKGVDDTVSTWAPSGSDALADDWQLVE